MHRWAAIAIGPTRMNFLPSLSSILESCSLNTSLCFSMTSGWTHCAKPYTVSKIAFRIVVFEIRISPFWGCRTILNGRLPLRWESYSPSILSRKPFLFFTSAEEEGRYWNGVGQYGWCSLWSGSPWFGLLRKMSFEWAYFALGYDTGLKPYSCKYTLTESLSSTLNFHQHHILISVHGCLVRDFSRDHFCMNLQLFDGEVSIRNLNYSLGQVRGFPANDEMWPIIDSHTYT